MTKPFAIATFSLILLTGCAGTAPKLGLHHKQLTACPSSPNCVNSQATDAAHAIAPIGFVGTQHAAQTRLLTLLNGWARTKTTVVEADYIRAEVRSKLWRFVDDVEFYFPATQHNQTIIHVRSASRVGYSDFGVNRARIENIRAQFEASK